MFYANHHFISEPLACSAHCGWGGKGKVCLAVLWWPQQMILQAGSSPESPRARGTDYFPQLPPSPANSYHFVTKGAHRNMPFFHWDFQGHFCWERLRNAHKSSCAGDDEDDASSLEAVPMSISISALCAWERSVPSWRGVPFSVPQFPHLQEMNPATCIPLHAPAWFIRTAWTPAGSQKFLKR